MAAGRANVVSRVEKLAEPIAHRLGLEIWDIEFVKEGVSWYLRIYIDKPGGVSLDDCEAFSRALDGPLDKEDPIDSHYYLEVSSPGVERELKKPSHFRAMAGRQIKLRLIRPDAEGRRELEGRLAGYDDGVIEIETASGIMRVKKAETSHVRLSDTQDLFGGEE